MGRVETATGKPAQAHETEKGTRQAIYIYQSQNAAYFGVGEAAKTVVEI